MQIQISIHLLYDLLCDGLLIIWTQRIIDEDKIISAVIFNVEKREIDHYGLFLWSSDLPLTSGRDGVTCGVPWRCKFFCIFFFSFQKVETVHWE